MSLSINKSLAVHTLCPVVVATKMEGSVPSVSTFRISVVLEKGITIWNRCTLVNQLLLHHSHTYDHFFFLLVMGFETGKSKKRRVRTRLFMTHSYCCEI